MSEDNVFEDLDARAIQNMSAYDYGYTYGSQSDFGTDTDTYGTDDQDSVSKLYRICFENFPKNLDNRDNDKLHESQKQMRRAALENAWSLIRRWFKKNRNPDDRRKAACYQGNFSRTALHLCCKCPGTPMDIIADLIDCFPQTVQWPDSQGWLPLHHACAYGLSGVVLSLLCDSYPEGKIMQDKKGRTPLHFLFYRQDQDEDTYDDEQDRSQTKVSMRDLVDLLADTGAYSIPDESGLIPMHYACAYGATHTVLNALLRYDPTSIYASEQNSRTPIHYAMSNAQQAASPTVLSFLLNVGGTGILNKRDKDQHLPIDLLVSASKSVSEIRFRSNVIECIKVFLSSEPKVDAEMFNSIQSLPTWLRDYAVIHPHMQNILNRKVSKPLHSCLVFIDFLSHICLLFSFEFTNIEAIRYLDNRNDNQLVIGQYLFFLAASVVWFLFRELMLVWSKLSIGKILTFFSDYNHYFDIFVIITICAYIISLQEIRANRLTVSTTTFSSVVCVLKFFYYVNLIRFIRSLNKTISVFASGVVYVLRRLHIFLLMLGLVLVMFSFMFFFLSYETKLCTEEKNQEDFPNLDINTCNAGYSFIKMVSMMMGEIGNFNKPENKVTSPPANQYLYEAIFLLYAFIVVIVLSNMLIAITVDSYGVIKNERAVMVFWSNRLDQVAEKDAFVTLFRKIFCCEKTKEVQLVGPTTVQERPGARGEVVGGQTQRHSGFELQLFKYWEELMEVFKDDSGANSISYFSYEFLLVNLTRIIVLIIIAMWFIVGFLSLTILWPPQIREAFLNHTRGSTPHNAVDELLWDEFDSFKETLKVTQRRLKEDMKIDQVEIDELNFEVYDVQKNVVEDMIQVKEIMDSLLETMKNQLERKEMRSRNN